MTHEPLTLNRVGCAPSLARAPFALGRKKVHVHDADCIPGPHRPGLECIRCGELATVRVFDHCGMTQPFDLHEVFRLNGRRILGYLLAGVVIGLVAGRCRR